MDHYQPYFDVPTSDVTLAIHAFLADINSLYYPYNVWHVRDIIDQFLGMVARLPPSISFDEVDGYFVRVYFYLADKPPGRRPRLTIFRNFAQQYSRITRTRAVQFWLTEAQTWRQLHETSHRRLDLLREVNDMRPDPEADREEIESSLLSHAWITINRGFALTGLSTAYNSCKIYISYLSLLIQLTLFLPDTFVEQYGVYWDPPTPVPPRWY